MKTTDDAIIDRYRAEGSHLYEYRDGAYIHCYQNPRAKNIKRLIEEYEELLREEGEL